MTGMLACGSSGCDLADDPAYLFAQGVGSGVLDSMIYVTVDIIGGALGNALFPGLGDDAPE